MDEQKAFFLLSPEHIVNENAENYHVFTGYHEVPNEWIIRGTYSVCGQVERKSKVSPTHMGTDETDFLHRLVDLHAEGKNICGRCMAHFFADDDASL